MKTLVEEYFELAGMKTLLTEQMKLLFDQQDSLADKDDKLDPKLRSRIKTALLTEGVEELTKQAGRIIEEVFQPAHLQAVVDFLKTDAGRHSLFNAHMMQRRLHKTGVKVGEAITDRVIDQYFDEKESRKKRGRK